MMEIQKTHIVCSEAGHDKGKYFYVTDTDGEFLLLADGKTRKLLMPKRKKRKHVCFCAESGQPAAEKIRRGETLTDGDVRKTLGIARRQGTLER
jgi:hypothetical protein